MQVNQPQPKGGGTFDPGGGSGSQRLLNVLLLFQEVEHFKQMHGIEAGAAQAEAQGEYRQIDL